MTDTHGPARRLVERTYDALHGDPYSNRLRRELCAAADAHDAAFAALVEAAEAALQWLSAEVWTWEGAVEWGEQLRAALKAAKGWNSE